MSRHFEFVALSRVILGTAMLSCISCMHVLKPKTPSLISSCYYPPDQFDKDLKAYRAAMPNDAVAHPLRDRMVNSIICEIDNVFGQYKTTFLKGRSAFSITSDTVQAGLAASATAVNGARGKTIISAFLAGVTGLDLSIDKNLFAQQTFQSIENSMESRRDAIHTTILKRLANETTVTYPFEQAQADLVQFFYAGTSAGGLQELASQSGTQATQSQQKLQAQMAAAASKQDLLDATALNHAIRQALTRTPPELEKIRAFLKAIGADEDVDTMQPNVIYDRYVTNYAPRVITDLSFRRLVFDAARNTGLIH